MLRPTGARRWTGTGSLRRWRSRVRDDGRTVACPAGAGDRADAAPLAEPRRPHPAVGAELVGADAGVRPSDRPGQCSMTDQPQPTHRPRRRTTPNGAVTATNRARRVPLGDRVAYSPRLDCLDPGAPDTPAAARLRVSTGSLGGSGSSPERAALVVGIEVDPSGRGIMGKHRPRSGGRGLPSRRRRGRWPAGSAGWALRNWPRSPAPHG